jgi:hypothetical protein
LNITPNEEDGLIGLLNSDIEEEEEEIIREVEDVINLDAQEITVEAKYDDDDDDDFISISSEHAPEFVTSRMTPSGVVEAEANPNEEDIENEDEGEDLDLGGIAIPNPPSKKDVEYEEVSEEIEEESELVKDSELPPAPVELPPPPAPVELPPPPAPVELPPPPAPVELPPPPAPVELPPPPAPVELPPNQTTESPYLAQPNISTVTLPSNNGSLLTKGSIWPWPAEKKWDSRDLRRELLDAMAAAKSGNNSKAEETLDRIGPHLGDSIDLLFHIGVLLKRFGRDYELMQMLTKAQAQYPGDSNVSNAISKLS